MLPVRRDTLSRILISFAAGCEAGEELRIRVGLADGTRVTGVVLSTSADHVSLRVPPTQARYIPLDEIRLLQVAKPHRVREWALATVGIVGATASLVALAWIPGIGEYIRSHGATGFMITFYLGVGALAVLLTRTGLRQWLTRWETLIDEPEM